MFFVLTVVRDPLGLAFKSGLIGDYATTGFDYSTFIRGCGSGPGTSHYTGLCV
jgi:hypothetical protein